jgi:hypothetical protein
MTGRSKVLNIFGLCFSLGGVLLLLVFGMPVHVSTIVTGAWSVSNINFQLQRFDDIYSALAWIGLGTLIFGTLLQLLATIEQR